MTSNNASVPGPGAAAGRRRALGRGPGTASAGPEPGPEPAVTDPAAAETVPEPVTTAASPGPVAAEPVAGEPETGGQPVAAAPSTPEPETGREAVSPHALVRDPEKGAEPVAQGATAPGPAAPGTAVSGTPASGAAAPGTAASRAAAPRGAVPGAAAAETAAPGAVPGGSVAVVEGVPDGVFKVRLANFEGPFDLLLQLISKHKLDVTEVALSKVTDEFMAHIRAMGPDWDLDQTTEFLVVAATLLDLKAARLLPAAEVEDEADLALLEARDLLFARLLQYRAYKQIADIFTHRLESEGRRYPRTVGLEPHHAELLPEVVIRIGAEGFARLAVKAMQPRAKPQVYVDHIHAPLVSVQEQAGIVVARLRELGEASFRALVADTDDTLTVVARFLALLELYREKAVALDQETALGELLVRWTGGDGEAQPRVTDEFDRPPEEPGKETKT
ncbi:segregation and condensation protein A [Streptomyces achromogenes]|uniref:segregation and condensation protein A n=1 Tax=Streptomyces achromogenes TaxID=67255 RepID=UPI0027D77369|nr:segregation/condensation protein A [Streptomyces achromogenes]